MIEGAFSENFSCYSLCHKTCTGHAEKDDQFVVGYAVEHPGDQEALVLLVEVEHGHRATCEYQGGDEHLLVKEGEG